IPFVTTQYTRQLILEEPLAKVRAFIEKRLQHVGVPLGEVGRAVVGDGVLSLLLGGEAGDTHREDVRRPAWRLWAEFAGVTIEHTDALDLHRGGSFDRGVPGEHHIVFVNGDGL